MLSAACFHTIPRFPSLKTSTSSVPPINTVSGDRLPILGQVTLPLEIEGRCHSCRMYVIEDLGFEVVLGRGFLEEKGAVINFHNGTVQLTDEDPVIHEPIVHSVRAVATYVIPPRSETIIPAKLGQCLTPEVEGLIEPGPQSFSSPEPTILLACGRNRELWEQPFQACAIDAACVKPDGQNSVFFLCYFKIVVPRALVF